MKSFFLLLLLLVISPTAFAQTKKHRQPEQPIILREDYSSVYDIRRFEKFYVQMDFKPPRKSAAPILKVLNRDPFLKAAKDWDDAQFVVTYKEMRGESPMQVYYVQDKRMVIVWTEERPGKDQETELAEEFLKVLQRNRKLDEKPLGQGDG